MSINICKKNTKTHLRIEMAGFAIHWIDFHNKVEETQIRNMDDTDIMVQEDRQWFMYVISVVQTTHKLLMTEIKIAIKNIHSILDTICPQLEKSIFDRNIAKKTTMYQYNI
jgi:hypothetical protein